MGTSTLEVSTPQQRTNCTPKTDLSCFFHSGICREGGGGGGRGEGGRKGGTKGGKERGREGEEREGGREREGGDMAFLHACV